MRASVPHDVDLEDHLVYGLTPLRFGYLVVAVLGAVSVWGLRWLPLAARAAACFLLVAAAAVLAWGRWRGRPLDRYLLDVGVFLRRNYRLQLAVHPRRGIGSPTPTGLATVSFAAINMLGGREARPGREEPG